jgi:hypothetical protein
MAMNRREFLSRSMTTLLIIPVAGGIAACGSDSPSPSPTCDGVLTTSTVTEGHTHTLCVPTGDLTNPPSAGQTYTTSMNAAHTHTVTLTQQQLQMINTGGTVTVTSSSPASHDFMIHKA